MTIGIYKLEFAGLEDWPYIGQSVNIESRYERHCYDLRSGRSNYMLQEAYSISQSLPKLSILEEVVGLNHLNDREVYWINELNSVSSGLNLTNKVDKTGRGQDNLNSTLTNTQVIEIFFMIVNNPKKLLTHIAKDLQVSISIVSMIAKGINHTWLKDKFPLEYKNMLAQSRIGLWDAEHQGIEYPLIMDPKGNIHKISNLQEFARIHNLNNSSLCQVLHKKRKTVSRWRLA